MSIAYRSYKPNKISIATDDRALIRECFTIRENTTWKSMPLILE